MAAERRVVPTPNDEDEVLASIRPLSRACKENILMVAEELEHGDPEIAGRCGLLADRYEVYALTVPACGPVRLVVSLDFGGRGRPAAMIHGVVPRTQACAKARRVVTRHRSLLDPSWEESA